jgi:hypothetical protein
MKMQAIDQGVTVQAYIVNSIWKIVLHDEASVHQRKAAKEPKLHSDFLGKRNIFAVMDGTIPQPSALAAKEPKP